MGNEFLTTDYKFLVFFVNRTEESEISPPAMGLIRISIT